MLFRWQAEPVNLPSYHTARILLEVPVMTTDGKQKTVQIPIVCDLDDASQMVQVLVQNGYHVTIQPVEVDTE